VDAFLGREATEEQEVFAGSLPTLTGPGEVRFDDDLAGLEPRLDVLLPDVLAYRNEQTDPLERAYSPVDNEGRGKYGTGSKRRLIAAVKDARPWGPAKAIVAHHPVSKECCGEALEPIVVQCHHHGDVIIRHSDDRWRQSRKQIVAVHQFRPPALDQLGYVLGRSRGPDRSETRRHQSQPRTRPKLGSEDFDSMPRLHEQAGLILYNPVFA
jgi:hypothetical protein